jgi:Flp pilus assembly protein TadG
MRVMRDRRNLAFFMSSRILNLPSVFRRSGRQVAREAWRLGRKRDGGTAIEFAIVIFPFLAILFAIIETAIVFYASQVLETAVADTGRLIMTGQAQKGGLNQETFKQEICTRLKALFNCASGVHVDVKKYGSTYGSFTGVDLSMPLNEEGALDTSTFGYEAGIQGDIIVIRAVYEWPVIMPGFGFNLATLPNGKRLLMSTAAFRNENYHN